MNFIFYLLLINASSDRIKILTKDRLYELSIHPNKTYSDEATLKPTRNTNDASNYFIYFKNRGGLMLESERYLKKGNVISQSKYNVISDENIGKDDAWSITPKTDFVTISNSSGQCFAKGQYAKKENSYRLVIEPCNDTDSKQHFVTIDIDRVWKKQYNSPNISEITDVESEPLYLGI